MGNCVNKYIDVVSPPTRWRAERWDPFSCVRFGIRDGALCKLLMGSKSIGTSDAKVYAIEPVDDQRFVHWIDGRIGSRLSSSSSYIFCYCQPADSSGDTGTHPTMAFVPFPSQLIWPLGCSSSSRCYRICCCRSWCSDSDTSCNETCRSIPFASTVDSSSTIFRLVQTRELKSFMCICRVLIPESFNQPDR